MKKPGRPFMPEGKKKDTTITIKLHSDLKQEIKQLAKQRNVTLTNLILEALEQLKSS